MKSKSITILLSPFLVQAASLFILSTALHAEQYNWNTTTGTWDTTAANWSGAGSTWVNGAGSDALFNNTATASTITLEGALSAGAVAIGNGSNNFNYTLTSGSGASLSAASVVLQGYNGNGPLGGPSTVFDDLTLNVSGNLGVGRAWLRIMGDSVVNVAGTIGGGGITSSPDWGVLEITGNANVTASGGVNGNAEAWGLFLSGGTLTTPSIQASDREDGATGRLIFSGTTVVASADNSAFVTVGNNYLGTNSAQVNPSGAIFDSNGHDIGIGISLKDGYGAGTLTKLGTGTLTLSGQGTYTGVTTVNAGKLIAGTTNGVTGIGSGAIFVGDTTGSSDATVQLGSANSTGFANSVTIRSGSSGAMALNGSGNIDLYGTVTLGSTGSSGKSVTIANYGDPLWTYNLIGVIQDPSGMTAGTAGTVTVGVSGGGGTVRFSAANTYTGNTRVAADHLQITNAYALQNSTLDMNASDAGTISFYQDSVLGGLSGSRSLNMNGRYLIIGNNNQNTTYSGVLSNGNLTKIGAGTLNLTANHTYSGVTELTGGVLNVATIADYGADSSVGNRASDSGGNVGLLFRGGTLQYTGSTAQSTNRSIRISTYGGASATIDASGSNPSATLSFTATSSTDFFENPGSRSLTLTGSNTGNNSFNMAIGEAGGTTTVTKSGTGKWVLSGSSTYTGATTVSGGSLVVNGNISTSSLITVQSGATIGGSGTVGSLLVEEGASINPGNSPGILTVNGDYNQAGLLTIEVNGLTSGTQHDQVNVDRVSGNGSVTLSGGLNVVFGGGYTPVNGDMLFILLNDSTDSITGTFSGLAQNALVTSYGGYDWRISYTADDASSSLLGGNDIALYAVPETSSALLGGLGLLALLRRRRG